MSTKPALSGRAAKLENLFYSFIKGDRSVRNSQEAKQFFEAVDVLCEHTSAVSCVERIIGRKEGLSTVRVAIRSNLSRAFITTATTAFLKRVLHHDVKIINDGLFLEKLLVEILSPSTFWTTFLGFYQCNELEGDTLVAFASLCLEIVSSSSPDIRILSNDVESLMKSSPLTKSSLEEVRTLGYRIEKVIQLRKGPATASIKMNYSPGGRHDNDFEDFRKISIFPTADEVSSKEEPFLQRLDDVFEIPRESRTSSYISWLFRLLREDMLADLREDLQIAWGQKKAKYKPLCLGGLSLVSYDLGTAFRARPFTLMVQCREGITFPPNKRSPEAKKKYLEEYKNFVKHSAIGALCLEKDIIAFGSIVREVDGLIKDPPVVGIQVTDNAGLKLAIKALMSQDFSRLKFYVVDTATFSYEPILQRLKEVTEIPIENAILDPAGPPPTYDPPPRLRAFIRELINCRQKGLGAELGPKLGFKRTIQIRDAQLDSLIKGLENPVGQIQGPPGTGKSFIGAIIAKVLMELTEYRILVLSYTNHALDQFLEDLMDIGIDENNMVRIGSKATARTDALRIDNLSRIPQVRSSLDIRPMLNATRGEQLQTATRMDNLIQSLKSHVPLQEILDTLEFSDSGMAYWSAFQVPDGEQIAGKKNKPLQPVDVFGHWLNGKNLSSLGMLAANIDPEHYPIWNIPPQHRQTLYNDWVNQARQEQIDEFAQLAETANNLYRQIDSLFKESKRNVVKHRRIIGCTTTGAAMYQSIIRAASPDIVLVEEAGEILEAHVITSLSPSVKQLILIGDHKQLRPKVNNYNLTVEKGEGFDLNVSLFERLIRQGHRFAVLQEQFRSHPDISQFARLLAYPELKDVPKTHSYKPIRGLQKRVVFVHHEHPEEQLNNVSDRRDPTSKASKKNTFEAEMVLKTVKYLSQQGYKSEDMVVLTPYMGQLSLLRQTLSEINDPYLNELDTHDLVRAGLMTHAASKAAKAKLRLSTVDNYQGEESDIVIISMARSNKNGDIGFLVACERLVVLMSRARKGIILYGNTNTFLASKKGGELWKKYFDAMKEKGFLFDGLPVHCEQHPTRLSILQKPQDFDQHCPDGGCAESCGAVLGCGKHTCERRCHRLTDHSQVPCTKMMKKTCERGHNIKYLCGKENQGCKSCAKEDEEMRRRIQRDLDMEKKRQERQDKYQRDLQEIDDEIDHHRRVMKYDQEEADQAKELAEKKSHLESLRQTKARMEASKAAASKQKNVSKAEQEKSQQKQLSSNYADLDLPAQEWEDMKRDEGAHNDALDDLMGLIGLESVKREFLSVKTNVDIKIRQGVALSDTRLSCSLLGNPGTGKTTVARIWGKFLTGIGAIPGDAFKETTGSKLANMGVKGCEDLLEQIKEDGGGVLFIDEAYQLSSGNSPGGKAVLDYLLAEVENLRGKVVFVLAGYSKQMESFFAHNPGFPSRFPITMNFEDYTDKELLRILKRQVNRKYNNKMEIEDGPDGLYFRIAARRVGRGRGKEGFGNARSIENCLARIEKRQANRIRLESRAKKSPNDFLFTKEDIIGPEPSLSLQSCKSWKKMNEMIGLKEVKEQVKILLDSLTTNYERELAEEPPMEFTLNRVFLGSPGTGKTTVAKLYGEILATLGLLSNGELVMKTPADFIGSHLGQSESQTKGILASTIGKVLVIDEAYGLYGGKGVTDPYKTAVVDTIVGEVQNVPGDDRCVILIGYQEQMEEMFQNVNPGLSRRFSVDTPFAFEDFDDDALRKVLDLKLKASGFTTTGEGKTAALDVLIRERNRPNFGNGGAVTNLLSRAMTSYQKRYSDGKIKRNQLEAEDFDKDFDRATRKETNVKQLFQDDIGREEIIQKLESIQSQVRQLKALGMDVKEEIPFNFLFRGPPGTGKTTTARKMGKVYYDMGFLSKATVEECSATDLIGQYVGQTGPKVQKVLEKSLGRVLLIDEAYRFAGGGFAQEAIDELVGLITTPKYQGKLIIILAGYEHDINRLLSVNAGLTSRFPESIDFKPLKPDACFRLLVDLLRKRKTEISSKGKKNLDISCLETPSALFLGECTTIFAELSKADGWASARDVKQLARNVFQTVNLESPSLKLERKGVIQELNRMLRDRQSRMNKSESPVPMDEETESSSAPQAASRTSTSVQAQQSTTADQRHNTEDPTEEANKEPESLDDEESRRVVRDAGVSDEVWEQLQKDQAKEERKKAEYRDLLEARKSAEAARKKIVQELIKEEELKEEERLKLEEAKKKAEAAREKILRQLIEQEERRKKEVAKQAKIRALGICPAGFDWIKQNGGYRCSGGSHFLSDAEIDKHMQ